jgi:deoxyribodipyrimidine photo-lyase
MANAAGKKVLVWFRRDFRLHDQPALSWAQSAREILPVYICERGAERTRASDWWLHGSIKQFDAKLRSLGSRLVLLRGDPRDILPKLAREHGVDVCCWNRLPSGGDGEVESGLRHFGIAAHAFEGGTVLPLGKLKTGSGGFYQVFTPFWQAGQKETPSLPLAAVAKLPPLPQDAPEGVSLSDLELLPEIPWDRTMRQVWQPGESAALEVARGFMDRVRAYKQNRDIPSMTGTSRLSPYLCFGEISVRTLWHELGKVDDGAMSEGVMTYAKELFWREFAYNILFHRPDTVSDPMRPEFKSFPWRTGAAAQADLRRWQRGETGYPIVDAGMRELWHTGWMHNRVRMVVASFLVKHLLIHWRAGAAWFQDTLVDFDLASNTFGWQWSAGCGADAAPFFRIFNPVTQGEKFDPDGVYIKTWVPELAPLSRKDIHTPWLSSQKVAYPEPMVDHRYARERALEMFSSFRR